MRDTNDIKDKEEARQRIAKDIQDFLDKGGKPTLVPAGQSAYTVESMKRMNRRYPTDDE